MIKLVKIYIYYSMQIDMSAMSAGTCKMMSYVEMLTALASVINLSAVSIERWKV